MIHQIGVELGQYLALLNCPFTVVDGPERRPTTTGARERIVIEHDPAGDGFETRHLADKNPRTRLTRKIGAKVTIYARQPSAGATYWEHIRRTEHVLDMVLCGLDVIAKQRKNAIAWRSGRFVDPVDLRASETPGGAVYELLFTVDRGVAERRWDNSVLQQVMISPSMSGAPNLTFNAAAHTITRDVGSWFTDRFAVGLSIIVADSTLNNGAHGPISALTDSVMTFASGLVNEGPVGGVALTGSGVVVRNNDTVSGPDGSSETI